ncbi:MAG: hypothetical protein VZR73_05165 [Acutalibacteraceae bacterium]|nr:hypothetical protein [Acutalibacteraceae bacterium]
MKKTFRMRLLLVIVLVFIQQYGSIFDLFRAESTEIYRTVDRLRFFESNVVDMMSAGDFYMSLLLFVILILCWGNYIYKDLEVSSIYYFTRNSNIGKWYCRRIGGLTGYSFLFSGLYFLISMLIAELLTSASLFQAEDLSVVLRYTVFSGLYGFLLTAAVNSIAVLIGAVKSAVLVNIFHAAAAVLGYSALKNSFGPGFRFSQITQKKYLCVCAVLLLMDLAVSVLHYLQITHCDLGLIYSEDAV